MAAIASLSSIATPSPSSSSRSLSPHTTDHPHSLRIFSPKPTKHLKTLTVKPLNYARYTLPLVFRLHLFQCASSSTTVDDTVSEVEENPDASSSEVEQNPDAASSEVEQNPDVASSDSSDDGRLYVGNLPYTMTSADLSEIFSRAGHVKSVEIIYDKVTDRSRGFGFVTLETIIEAKEAIRMFDGSEVEGRSIRVNIPEVPNKGGRKMMAAEVQKTNQNYVDTSYKVYAGNLAWGVTTQGLKDAFADQPGFVSAKVIFERERGRSRGFGFVSFESAEAAQSAISALDGVELEGRAIRLNIAADKSPANAETTEQIEVLSSVAS